jgi:hypothetical protein
MELNAPFVLIASRAEGSGAVLNECCFSFIGGALGTVPELLFESKKLIPRLQQLLAGK